MPFLFIIYPLIIRQNVKILKYIKVFVSKKVLIVFCISLLISNLIVVYLNNRYDTLYKDLETANAVGIIVGNPEVKKYSVTYKIKIENINSSVKYKDTHLYIKIRGNDTSLEYGDKVKISGEYIYPSTARNYKGFDYKEYLKSVNIYGTIEVRRNKSNKKELL